ncbi:MAG TPA: DUF2628 domain-containing protein [Xanthobacteraceae bacterium]|nr:DUF2628 domain-containing protein [Xanthobacteraceae bacterium]
MALWTVFEPDAAADESPAQRADRLVFVREAMARGALLLAPLVLLRHRLWLAFALYVLVQGLIGAALAVLDAPASAGLLMLLPNLVVALELAALRRASLERRGWREVGTVSADDIEAGERRFLEAWLPEAPVPAAPPAAAVRPMPAGVLGLFPEAAAR